MEDAGGSIFGVPIKNISHTRLGFQSAKFHKRGAEWSQRVTVARSAFSFLRAFGNGQVPRVRAREKRTAGFGVFCFESMRVWEGKAID